MDFLDKYKYHKDDPHEFGIELKDFKKDSSELDNSHLSNLLTNSVRVSKEILPKVGSAIETVFERWPWRQNRAAQRVLKPADHATLR